jgi:subtilisin family serine protease
MTNRNTFLLCIMFICASIFDVFAQGEPARQETNLDQVYTQYDLTGDGVVVAIIDRGIDYFHPDFIDPEGNTRLLFLFDMINQEGANDPNNPYGVGTIFDEEEINASLDNGGLPLSMDRYGHGTATTGIAAGNGSGTEDLAFQGVAPGAKVIAVKVTQDYFPPFDDQPGQDGFYNPAYIPIALQFVADKVGSMPCVTLINLGSVGGPTDGTSTVARAMDDFVDLGHTLVCGVGDDGGSNNHASATLSQGESIELKVQKGEAGFLRVDLWYDESDRFEVSLTRPDNSTEGPFPAPATANDSDDHYFSDFNYYHRGANVEFHGATSDRRELMVDFSEATGEYIISITATNIAGSGTFHASLNPATHGNSNEFINYIVEGYSLNDYTAAANVISPSDYVVKNDWIDMDGISRQITGQGNPGELWIGSSWGPTYDGRLGIDFAACGEVLYAAYSDNTWYAHFPHLFIQNGAYHYGIQNAVSAAAPLTTGVIALMLDMNSELSPAQIKEILQQTSRSDNFTGTVPNNQWGYGKLDALAAIQKVENLGIYSSKFKGNGVAVFPNPSKDEIHLQLRKIHRGDIKQIEILNNWGQKVMFIPGQLFNGAIDIGHLTSGIYHIVLYSNSGYFGTRFIKN